MGFYATRILPRLLDLSMRNKRLMPYRQQTISAATGAVLEVGVGSGLNLPLYGDADWVCGIEPSGAVLDYARLQRTEGGLPVLLARASAEELPFADSRFNTVVTTWTLCSIPRPVDALREMRRVLQPGGRLLFAEHGLAPDRGVASWQNRLTPAWKHVSGGCHLNRRIDELIRSAGFDITDLRTGYMPGPRLMTFMYQGSATPAPYQSVHYA